MKSPKGLAGSIAVNLGICKSLEVELQGAVEGFKLARRMGFKQIILESNSKTIVETLQLTNEVAFKDRNLLNQCRNILKADWKIDICHYYREANQCVDWMASYSLQCDLGII